MAIQSKDDNVFRFVHLRGARPTPDNGGGGIEPPPDEPAPTPIDVLRPDAGPVGPAAEAAQLATATASPRTLLGFAVSAKRELEGLLPGRDLTVPGADDEPSTGHLAVTEAGRRRLSDTAVRLLRRLDVGVLGTPVASLIEVLDKLISSSRQRVTLLAGARPQRPGEVPKVTAVGVAELLVVKQQITRYEPVEIAHVENVLAGEAKVRAHRMLDRTEEETEWFDEEVAARERELEATERFELKKETANTVQKDQQRGFGLSLSGRYGPTVEFSSELTQQNSTSQTTAENNAVDYARDVVERSRDTVTTTVREQRRRKLLREVEEINHHSLTNVGQTHVSGVYQFVDKIYTSQVFNYGLRQMFDFLVPEPASYLLHLNRAPRPDIEMPPAPVDLNSQVADASGIDEDNYLDLGAQYGVEGLVPPPPALVIRRGRVTHGAGHLTEEGRPRSFEEIDIPIPQGYRAVFAEIAAVLTSDDVPSLIITVGSRIVTVPKAEMSEVDLEQGNFKAYTRSRIVGFANEPGDLLASEKISTHVFANETANYTVAVKVYFWRTDAMLPWRIATYEKIAEAYRNLEFQYQQAVAEMNARREQELVTSVDFGSPPARNLKTISAELKKHCIAILRGTHEDDLSTAHAEGPDVDDPPAFDIAEAMSDGSTIRFLETAFEWDQLQYVCYPYFWARTERWAEHFRLGDRDPVFEEFLRAGSARVVVPVRPGLEAAVSHFVATGEPWDGQGEPTIDDPLYQQIVTEIQERAGAGKGEVPVGQSWETRIPTTAALVRKDDALPRWEKQSGTDWTWSPVS